MVVLFFKQRNSLFKKDQICKTISKINEYRNVETAWSTVLSPIPHYAVFLETSEKLWHYVKNILINTILTCSLKKKKVRRLEREMPHLPCTCSKTSQALSVSKSFLVYIPC